MAKPPGCFNSGLGAWYVIELWWELMDIKKASQSLVCEANELACIVKKAVCTGLEPVTPCVTGMYSNLLN